jgi:outer membrane protein OmpA-like peptidoglycan-associated protein
MTSKKPFKTLLSRRSILGTLASVPLVLAWRNSFAQSASDVNRIIKDLAPIGGQTPSGGYKPIKREPIIVEQETIFVDAARHVELEVFFEFDSDRITPLAQDQLSALGQALASQDLASFRYLIAGHTDAVGSDAYNLDLSARRAHAVFEYLTQAYPIDPHRLMVVGFGFRRLKRPDAPQAAINRRVEVLLIVP